MDNPTNNDGQEKISGPNFEPGPGWGAKIKDWLGRRFWTVVVPLAVAAGLYLGSRLHL